jgi:hypothetical protein
MRSMTVWAMSFLLPAIMASPNVLADFETLSVRSDSQGNWQAVISGLLTNACGFQFYPPNSIVKTDSSFVITSTNAFPQCYVPWIPPVPYETVAPLGRLPIGNYFVLWTVGGFGKSTSFSVLPTPVPTLSRLSLMLTIVVLAICGLHLTRRSTGRTVGGRPLLAISAPTRRRCAG